MAEPTKPTLKSADYVIADDHEACPLDRALRALQPGLSWNVLRRAITSGKVRVNDKRRTSITHEVRAGDRIVVIDNAPNPKRAPRLPKNIIVHIDSQVVVVRKPPGWLTEPNDDHPYGSLVQCLNAQLRKKRPGTPPLWVVQRLDQDTSGLIVLARTNEARDHLKEQFTERTVKRGYLAIAQGAVKNQIFRSRLADGARKHRSTARRDGGKEAVTHVRRLQPLEGASLVACRLETGRTHQIRVHLSEAGHPILGDQRYGYRGGIRVPRIMLHAGELGFVHPATGEALYFKEPPPKDMDRVVKRLQTKSEPAKKS